MILLWPDTKLMWTVAILTAVFLVGYLLYALFRAEDL